MARPRPPTASRPQCRRLHASGPGRSHADIGKYQVTTGGGNHGGWSRDGRQLYYGLNSDPIHGFAADVLSGDEFRLGPPRLAITFPKDQRGTLLDHSGKRLLALLPAGKDPTPSITMLLGGMPGASKR